MFVVSSVFLSRVCNRTNETDLECVELCLRRVRVHPGDVTVEGEVCGQRLRAQRAHEGLVLVQHVHVLLHLHPRPVHLMSSRAGVLLGYALCCMLCL